MKKEMPNQDSGIKKDCGKYRIFAAADLEIFARAIKEQGLEEKLLAGCEAGNANEMETERLVRQLANSIVGKWLEAARGELERNPLTEEERKKAPEEYMAGIRTERMYGTTLIVGLQTENYLLLIQQGDGRCVVFDGSGNEFQPIPRDEQCVGMVTTSLCDSDAAQNFRYCVIDLEKKPVIACIVGTDGIEDCFSSSMERTHAYYRGLLRYACENGVAALEGYCADTLRALSANGSEDDITVSGIIDVECAKLLLKDCEEKNRRATRMNDLLKKEDGIGMVLSKWEELKKKKVKAAASAPEQPPDSSIP